MGQIALISGGLLLIPLFMSIGFGDGTVHAFGLTITICIVLGALGMLCRPARDKRDMKPACGLIICGLAWILISIIGCIPFVASRYIPSFTDALFESVSGFTTTGATIIKDVEALPKSLLLWRALTQWIGGMGVLVLIIAILPKNDRMATQLVKAEMPGPQFGKLVSKLRFTAQILYAMYVVLTILLIAILCILKMPFFDSVCHAFTTASTGGFSIKNASIGAYNSVGIDVTITIFMLIFSVNFNVYYLIIVGQVLKALKHEETIAMFAIYILGTAAVVICLAIPSTYATLADTVRYSAFQTASIMSTTGFATANYTVWPVFSQVSLLVLMCIGGSASSTAGGMKVSRVLILAKSSFLGIKKTLSPRSVYTLKMDGKPLPQGIIDNTQTFFIIYILTIVLSTLLISVSKSVHNPEGLVSNISAVIACLNNVGPGLGFVGPASNYSALATPAKLILCFDMLIGRLEIFPILLLFYPKAWKKV